MYSSMDLRNSGEKHGEDCEKLVRKSPTEDFSMDQDEIKKSPKELIALPQSRDGQGGNTIFKISVNKDKEMEMKKVKEVNSRKGSSSWRISPSM